VRVQIRRGTATQWATAAPVLAEGEPGYDTTNKVFRVGDGVTAWASLPQIPAFVGGYSAFSAMTNYDAAAASGVPTLQARQEPGSVTRLEGNVVFSGIIGAGTRLFALPAGMAPANIVTITVRTRIAGVSAAFVTFATNGDVTLSIPTVATQIVDFDGVTFRRA